MFVSFGPIPSTPLQIIIIAAGYHKMNFLCVACVLWCVQKKKECFKFFSLILNIDQKIINFPTSTQRTCERPRKENWVHEIKII